MNTPSKKSKIAGWILSGIVIAFMLFDAFGKYTQPEVVIKGTTELGYPVTALTGLAVVLLVSTLLFAIPKTAVLGAILLTAYIEDAVATHVRVGQPWLSHTLFPVCFGIIICVGLSLRNSRVKNLFIN